MTISRIDYISPVVLMKSSLTEATCFTDFCYTAPIFFGPLFWRALVANSLFWRVFMSSPRDKKYKRILLKLSGEELMGTEGFGIDPKVLDKMALEIGQLV